MLTLAAFIFSATLSAQEKNVSTFTQKSVMSVAGSKVEATISFSVQDNADGTKTLTVHSFSYKNKTVSEFSLVLAKDKDEKYSAKNTTVNNIHISTASLSYSGTQVYPVLYMKYKPGKMPFPITLSAKKRQ
jgi:hypothetical protein